MQGIAGVHVLRVEGKVAGRLRAYVEVLMVPARGRNEYTRLVPGHDDLLTTSLGPHDRVAITGRDDDQDAWGVEMGLLIRAGWKHRHVGGDGRRSELDANAVAARAALLVGVEIVPGGHIGEEVPGPDGPTECGPPLIRIADDARRREEIPPIDQIGIHKLGAKVEPRIWLDGHRGGQIVVVDETRRLVPLDVGEL